jgi:SAM-dependent methyltransferase
MDKQHLSELFLKEADYWWHVNKRRLALNYIDDQRLSGVRILEVGCGGGYLSSLLLQAGADVVAADLLTSAAQFALEKGVNKGLTFDAGRPWPFAQHSFEIIIMLDVLEHVENDVGCLQEVRRVLRKGGRAVLSVPAHQFLFSSWDQVLGHHRRYSKPRLRHIFQDAGLEPVILSYQNVLSFLPALVLRGKDRILGRQYKHAEFPDVPESVNRLFKWWGLLESALVPINLPIGLSLFAVLKSD